MSDRHRSDHRTLPPVLGMRNENSQGTYLIYDMKHFLIIGIFLVFGLIVGEASAQSKIRSQGAKRDRKPPSFVLYPSVWERVDIQTQKECDDWPEGCAKQFLRGAGIELGLSPRFRVYRIGEREGRNLTVVIVTTKVADDDSVSGIRYRLAISLGDVEDNSFKLETLGRQYTCVRGHKFWGKDLCP